MLSFIKRSFKWVSPKLSENKKNSSSLILKALIGIVEDALFWRITWLSLIFIFMLNVLFIICINRKISFLGFTFCITCTFVIIDAFETWLKYKHRSRFLRKLSYHNENQLSSVTFKFKAWMKNKAHEYIYLREVNPTKAFLLVNIILGTVFIIGAYIDIYFLIYSLCMLICVSHKLVPIIARFVSKIHQNIESDGELDGLIPDVEDIDIRLLSIEPDNQVTNEKQSLDFWKPDDLPIEEVSDSSENSSSLVTNLSIEKMQTLEKDDTSDSSEDEYIPLVPQKDHLQSTLEEVQQPETWSSTAYNAFFNITGAVANMMYTKSKPNQINSKDDITRANSSEGFEVIDKNELI